MSAVDAPPHRLSGNRASSGSCSPTGEGPPAVGAAFRNGVPKQKRIACCICRKRKLKCDGSKPTCATCSRLGHVCAYDEIRRKSGPKRGYVKELEKRLQQVETQLRSTTRRAHPASDGSPPGRSSLPRPGLQLNGMDMTGGVAGQGILAVFPHDDVVVADNAASSAGGEPTPALEGGGPNPESSDDFPWEVMRLGLEEPLPHQDMINDLHRIYFEKLHQSAPMVHKYRYLAAMNLAPHMRPAVCLRYIIWALACSVTEKYATFQGIFYQRARKYIENDEMKGFGSDFNTVGHAQCWVLIATYEFKMMYFPRAWMSSGRATRLAQMLSLHRVDGVGLDVKLSLAPPRDWTDREERRRTFWAAYCFDRYASIGTGWPMIIDERDVMTNLPSSDEAYEKSRAQKGLSLAEAMTAQGAALLSSYGGVILMASLYGKVLTHLHRSEDADRPEDHAGGEFWARHRSLDGILLNTSMFLPEHLALATNARDANIVFLHLSIHSVAICLHQAAILKTEKHDLGADVVKNSTDRCFLAAREIVRIMQLISHTDFSSMNPFMSFCLYVAARVFIHAFKKDPNNKACRADIEFLLGAMQAHRKRNDITESFLVQLMVALDGTGFGDPFSSSGYEFDPKRGTYDLWQEGHRCAPVLQDHSEAQPSFHEMQRARRGTNPSTLPGSAVELSPSQYPASGFDVLPAGRGRGRSHSQHGVPPHTVPNQMQGVVFGQGWTPGYTEAPAMAERAASTADPDMSSDGRHSSTLSNQTGSAASYHGSPNSSYSPHGGDGAPPLDRRQAGQQIPPTPKDFYPQPDPFSGMHAVSAGSYHVMQSANGGTFAGAAWSLDAEAQPDALQALDNGAWTHMLDNSGMDGMGWEGWKSVQTTAHGHVR